MKIILTVRKSHTYDVVIDDVDEEDYKYLMETKDTSMFEELLYEPDYQSDPDYDDYDILAVKNAKGKTLFKGSDN